MPPQTITPLELKARIDANDDLVVIDVRHDWELGVSSVEFAIQVVMHEIPQRLNEIPHDRDVILICRSGGRSMQVAYFLEQQGWDGARLYNLTDGILGWARDVDPSLPRTY